VGARSYSERAFTLIGKPDVGRKLGRQRYFGLPAEPMTTPVVGVARSSAGSNPPEPRAPQSRGADGDPQGRAGAVR